VAFNSVPLNGQHKFNRRGSGLESPVTWQNEKILHSNVAFIILNP